MKYHQERVFRTERLLSPQLQNYDGGIFLQDGIVDHSSNEDQLYKKDSVFGECSQCIALAQVLVTLSPRIEGPTKSLAVAHRI
jgi:hypothetical protein